MLINAYSPVTESYFGKSQNLLEMEKLVQVLIDRFTVPFKDIGKRQIDAVSANKSKENKALEKLVCAEFGFKEAYIHWDGCDTVNAYTITNGILKLADDSVPALPIRNNNGRYYDSKHAYICVVNFYAGFIDVGLTAEEVVACMLHEIGHNFTCTPIVNVVSMVEWAFLPINIYHSVKNLIDTGKNIHDLVGAVTDKKLLRKDKDMYGQRVAELFSAIVRGIFRTSRYFSLIKSGIYRVFFNYDAPEFAKQYFEEFDKRIEANKNKILVAWDEIVKRTEKAKEFYKKNPDYINGRMLVHTTFDALEFFYGGGIFIVQKALDLQSGYSNEVFADSFATAYGYGTATVSLQRKISYYCMDNRSLAKANSYNVFNQYVMVMSLLLRCFIDEHPTSQTRMRLQIDKLRKELENPNVPPSLRKAMLKDLNRSEKLYDEYLNNFPKELKHLAVIINYIQLNEMYFGGKLDLREPINKLLNFGMDDA